jgi:hypothetical protein
VSYREADDAKSRINIYPNPGADELNIKLGGSLEGESAGKARGYERQMHALTKLYQSGGSDFGTGDQAAAFRNVCSGSRIGRWRGAEHEI